GRGGGDVVAGEVDLGQVRHGPLGGGERADGLAEGEGGGRVDVEGVDVEEDAGEPRGAREGVEVGGDLLERGARVDALDRDGHGQAEEAGPLGPRDDDAGQLDHDPRGALSGQVGEGVPGAGAGGLDGGLEG